MSNFDHNLIGDKIREAITQAASMSDKTMPRDSELEVAVDLAINAMMRSTPEDDVAEQAIRVDRGAIDRYYHVSPSQLIRSVRYAAVTGFITGIIFSPLSGLAAAVGSAAFTGMLNDLPEFVGQVFFPKEMEPRDGAIIGALVSVLYDQKLVEKNRNFPDTDTLMRIANCVPALKDDKDRQFESRQALVERLDALASKGLVIQVDNDRWDLGEGLWVTP